MLSNYWYWQSGSEHPCIILVNFVGLTSMILVFLNFFNFGNLYLFFPLSPGKILEKEMATHSSVLAWRIPGMGEPGGLPSMGSHRAGHDWSDLAAAAGGGKVLSISLTELFKEPIFASTDFFYFFVLYPTDLHSYNYYILHYACFRLTVLFPF